MATGTDNKSNLSFTLNKPHDVTYVDKPQPRLQNDHDVLVAINYTGICGSDVHYWEHGAIGHFVVEDPMVLGHESAGTVVQVGGKVSTLKPGDRVAVEPGYPCRRCTPCLAGTYNLCPDMRFAATPPYDGTLTGFWVAPADFCYKLPEHVSLQEGALFEPLAVAVHMSRQAEIRIGQSVVIMGAGPVGLLCAMVARAFGATKVVSIDIVPAKLEMAREVGATHTYLSQRVSAEENAKNIIRESELGVGADAVIDATGVEPSIQTSIHVLRRGGHFVQGGMGRPDITFPILAMCINEITVRGSFRYSSGDYSLALELVSSGRLDVKKLISEVVAFDKAEEAFKKVKQGEVIKILIAGPNEKKLAKVGGTDGGQVPAASPEEKAAEQAVGTQGSEEKGSEEKGSEEKGSEEKGSEEKGSEEKGSEEQLPDKTKESAEQQLSYSEVAEKAAKEGEGTGT